MGGEWNPLGGYYILRQKDAHTWVEVYLPGKGWQSVDPTPPDVLATEEPFSQAFNRWRLFWDYLQFKWYYWVVEYDLGKQKRVLAALGAGFQGLAQNPWRFQKINRKILFLILGLLLSLLIILFWKRSRRSSRPVERLLRRLSQEGWDRRPGETVAEYLARISQERPILTSKLRTFQDLYYREVFGGGGYQRRPRSPGERDRIFSGQR